MRILVVEDEEKVSRFVVKGLTAGVLLSTRIVMARLGWNLHRLG
jgi:hypothetical protein